MGAFRWLVIGQRGSRPTSLTIVDRCTLDSNRPNSEHDLATSSDWAGVAIARIAERAGRRHHGLALQVCRIPRP